MQPPAVADVSGIASLFPLRQSCIMKRAIHPNAVMGLTGSLLCAGALLATGCADPHYRVARERRDASIQFVLDSSARVEGDFGENLAEIQRVDRRLTANRKILAEDMATTIRHLENDRARRWQEGELVPPNFSNRLFSREITQRAEDFARLVY